MKCMLSQLQISVWIVKSFKSTLSTFNSIQFKLNIIFDLFDLLRTLATTGASRSTLTTYGTIQNLSFFNDGSYLERDRGQLILDSLLLCTIPPQSNPSCKLYMKDHWVAREMENVLWLPPDYRAVCAAARNNVLVLGHASGRVTFIESIPRKYASSKRSGFLTWTLFGRLPTHHVSYLVCYIFSDWSIFLILKSKE
jgi:hypothetical protein